MKTVLPPRSRSAAIFKIPPGLFEKKDAVRLDYSSLPEHQRVAMKEKLRTLLNDALEICTEWLTENTFESLVPGDMMTLMQPFIHGVDEARGKLKLEHDEIVLATLDKILSYILRAYEPHRYNRATRLTDPHEFQKAVSWMKDALNLFLV